MARQRPRFAGFERPHPGALAALWGAPAALRRSSSNSRSPRAPGGMTLGPDGSMWFTQSGSAIGRIEFERNRHGVDVPGIPLGPTWPESPSAPMAISGAALRTEDRSGRRSVESRLDREPRPVSRLTLPASDFGQIVPGPDGNLWFTDQGRNQIGRIRPQARSSSSAVPRRRTAHGITAGTDGDLWFTEPEGNKIGRITPRDRSGVRTSQAESTRRPLRRTPTETSGSPSLTHRKSDGSRRRESSPSSHRRPVYGIVAGADGSLGWDTRRPHHAAAVR